MPSRPAEPPFRREPVTLALYALLALLTSGYGIVGPLMPFLRADLDLTYTQGSYHTVALALGVLGMASLGAPFIRRIGRRGAVAAALIAMSTGVVLICLATHLAVSLVASAILGSSIALCVAVVPALMAERHSRHLGVAMGEANVAAYIGIFIVPGVVSLATGLAGWRWSFVLPVLVYGVFWLAIRRVDFGQAVSLSGQAGGGRLPFAYWCYWSFLALSVAAEFSMVVWGTSYLESVAQLPRTLALWSSMVFPAGMIIGRICGALLMRRVPAERLALPVLLIAGLGVLLFVAAPGGAATMAGLLLSGIGMGNLYPIGITLAMQSAAAARDAAASRASLASGSASLFAPLALGALADHAGMKAAFVTIPVLLVGVALVFLAGERARLAAMRLRPPGDG